jgi:hypothetical protein
MIELIKLFSIRMLCGCAISSIALTIAGEGAHREPVRLCCASLMIILLFSPYDSTSFSINELYNVKSDVETYINNEVAQSKINEQSQIINSIENHVKNKLKNADINCNVRIVYDSTQDEIKITKVYLSGEINSLMTEKVISTISEYIEIDRSDIIFE